MNDAPEDPPSRTDPGRAGHPPPGPDAAGRDPVVALFGEIVMIEQLARGRLERALPKGMELSHYMTLNHLAGAGGEKTPAQLARVFHVTKGAMTNTLRRLDAAGYIHIRPDWDDARRKWVSLSPAGQAARDRAIAAIAPVFDDVIAQLGAERLKASLPFLRAMRETLSGPEFLPPRRRIRRRPGK